jgi:hypothetical protein
MKAPVVSLALLASLAAVGACRRQPAQAAAASPPQHVDSVIPRDVELARFRAGLEPPVGLVGGAPTRDLLVQRFVRALERSDTVGLAALAINRGEFAYLYYPTNPEAQPPYDLSPGLMWFMMEEGSHKGLIRALEKRGGHGLGLIGHRCDGPPIHQGDNTVWSLCLVQHRDGGDTVQERLFGPIVERGGTFKFVSLANKL